jgi:hypothetical protein
VRIIKKGPTPSRELDKRAIAATTKMAEDAEEAAAVSPIFFTIEKRRPS